MTRRALLVESLEDRSLSAIAAFTVNLYDDAGSAIDSVQAGDRFYLEILAREYDPLVAGLSGIALDIAWDPSVLQAVDAVVTSDLPLFRSGALSEGSIENLAGYAFLSTGDGRAIGGSVAERFAVIQFEAVGPGDSVLSMRQGVSGVVTMPVLGLEETDIYFEQTVITVASGFVGPLTAEEYFKVPAVEAVSEPEFLEQVWCENGDQMIHLKSIPDDWYDHYQSVERVLKDGEWWFLAEPLSAEEKAKRDRWRSAPFVYVTPDEANQ